MPDSDLGIGLYRSRPHASSRIVSPQVEQRAPDDPGLWRHWSIRMAGTLVVSISILIAALLQPSSSWPEVVAGLVLGALAAVLTYLLLVDRPSKEVKGATETETKWKQFFRVLSLMTAVGTTVLVIVERVWRGSPTVVPDIGTYAGFLVVLVSVVVLGIAIRVLIRPSSNGKGLLGALRFDETNVVVYVKPDRRAEVGLADRRQPYERVKAWTIDARGNLTVWTADAAKATYPAGSWARIERMTHDGAVKALKDKDVIETTDVDRKGQSPSRGQLPFQED